MGNVNEFTTEHQVYQYKTNSAHYNIVLIDTMALFFLLNSN